MTLPFLLYILTDHKFGVKYPTIFCVFLGILSNMISNHILENYKK